MACYRRYVLVGAAAVMLAAAGCVNSERRVSGSGDTSSSGVDAGSIDAGPVEKNDGGRADVPDDIVASVDIRLDPAYHVYAPDTEVDASATVFDTDGNRIDDPQSLNWSVEPASAAETSGNGTITFREEGVLTLEACATLGSGQTICGEKQVAVDGDLPNIDLDKPAPGAMLGGNSSGTIQVEGQVSDSHGDVTAVLNGRRLSLDSDGNFATEIEPDFGVNTIHIVANDGFNRADASTTRSVLWAPSYKELGSDLTFSFDRGIGIELGQNFFDDGQLPARRNMDRELVTKDFADLLRVVVTNIDLMSQIPNPLISSGETNLVIDDVTLGEPNVDMDITDSGLKAYLHIDSLELETSGSAQIEGETLDLTGKVLGRISAYTSIGVDKPSAGESFDADVETVDISLDKVAPNFASDRANALFELAEGALRTKLEDRLVKAVEDEIVATLPQMVTQTLDSVEQTLADQTFTFSSELTGTREIHFQGTIDKFNTNYRRSMSGRISNEVETPGTDVYPDSRGIPLYAPSDAGLPFHQAGRIQIAFRLGLLNGILSGIWKTGYLDLDLSDNLPSQISGVVEEAKLEGQMPPVFRPAERSEPYDLILEAGQLEIEAKALGQTDTYGVNVRAGINVSLDDGELSLSIPDDPELDSWLIETTGDSAQLSPDDLNRLILSEVWPRIEKSLQGGMNLTLPTPDISQFQQISPALTDLSLSFALQRPLTVRNGYVLFDAALEGVLPIGN